MKQYALLRLLLACFFLYLAWPVIHQGKGGLSFIFWGCWLLFFLFVIGANLAVLLKMTRPREMAKEKETSLAATKN